MDTHAPQAHIRLECHEEVFVSVFCVHSTKVGTLSFAALFFLKAGYCEDSLKTLYEESVLSIFLGCSGKVCVKLD